MIIARWQLREHPEVLWLVASYLSVDKCCI